MKNIILIIVILVGTLISSNVMCQVIKVNVSETHKFYRYGEFKNPIDVINTPDVDYGLEIIDCDYIFDLQGKTSTFFSRSNNGWTTVVPIVNVEKVSGGYILTTSDYGTHDPTLSYMVKIYINTEDKTLLYTYYDSYTNRTVCSKINNIIIDIVDLEL